MKISIEFDFDENLSEKSKEVLSFLLVHAKEGRKITGADADNALVDKDVKSKKIAKVEPETKTAKEVKAEPAKKVKIEPAKEVKAEPAKKVKIEPASIQEWTYENLRKLCRDKADELSAEGKDGEKLVAETIFSFDVRNLRQLDKSKYANLAKKIKVLK